MNLNERLRRALREHPAGPMRAIELARQSGLSKQAVSLMLNGTTKTLSSTNAQRIARVLRVTTAWLVNGEGPMRQEVTRGASLNLREELFEIPFLDVAGSMGPGAVPADHIDTVRAVAVNPAELKKQCSFTQIGNLQIITGLGESMLPTFQDGDPILVDTGIKEVRIDAVYVYELDGELYIKRLQRMPGRGIRVISDNRSAYDSYDLSDDQLERINIKGRVVLAWNSRRL